MKYIVDLDTNNSFVQIFGATETFAPMEAPVAFQVRGGISLVEKIASAMDEVEQRCKEIEDLYHENDKARADFDLGFVVFRPGNTPVTCVVQARRVSLLIGERQFGNGSIQVKPFQEALAKVLPQKKPLRKSKGFPV